MNGQLECPLLNDCSYIIGAATEQQIKDYLDPQSKSSKYYDISNQDPRLFQVWAELSLARMVTLSACQLDSVLVNVDKSTLIPGELSAEMPIKVDGLNCRTQGRSQGHAGKMGWESSAG